MSTEKSFFNKADIINFIIISFTVILIVMAFAQIALAFNSDDPLPVLADLRSWVIGIISGAFLSYGVLRGNSK